MSVTVKFYSFAKRINSTKQPSGAASLSADCIIKRGSSIVNPSIELDIGLSTNPSSYNYAYISEWNRYYFVHDWVFNDRLWTAQLSSDPMASVKTEIGTYVGYVARAASSYNLNIVDNYYPALADNTHEASITTSPFDNPSGGSYIIGIMGKGTSNTGGAVTYYRASSGGIKALLNYLMDDPSGYGVSDISNELLKCVFNPLQYIVSCMWVPFSPPVVNTNDIDFGWWSMSIAGIARLSSLDWGTNINFTIPKHPKAATRGVYLNLPPFSRYSLEAGPWGIIPLDAFNLLGASQLDCNYKVDLITGSGKFGIKYRDKLIYEQMVSAQIGVPIQLGQNVINQGALSNGLDSVVDIAKSVMHGDVAGLLKSGLSAIGDAAAITQSVPSTMGSNGTLSYNNIFGLMADFLDIADEDIASRGRPLCKAVQISTLSGYAQCIDADPELSCTDGEAEIVRSYMNGGFYYE